MFESGCDVIGTVAMPPEIASWIASFVDQFHGERVFHKRKRDRAGRDPQRMPGGAPDERTGPELVVLTRATGTRASVRDGRNASCRPNRRIAQRRWPAPSR